MTELDHLYAAVVASPASEAPRRAYAAAVKSSDPPRAELIERQLDARAASRRGETPRTDAIDVLIARHGGRWAGDLAGLVDDHAYWGGFVEEVKMSAVRLVAEASRLPALAPIRHLSIRKLKGQVAAIAALPLLGQLASLDVGSSHLGDADVEALVASPHLRALRMLAITNNPAITIASLRALAALPNLRYVESSETEAPLVIKRGDWAGTTDIDFSAVREQLVRELGPRAWLDALDRPSLDAL